MYLPNLPGKSAHLKMAPEHRVPTLISEASPPPGAIESAVLVLLFPQKRDNPPVEAWEQVLLEWDVLLIERTVYDGVHSGEIAFPGGKREKGDKDLIETACREANEELALKYEHVTVFGQMTPLYVPPSNHLIYPVLACACWEHELIPHPHEVQSYKKIPLHHFNPENSMPCTIDIGKGKTVKAPAYIYEGYSIWGATAMILSELYQLVLDAKLITSFIRP